MTNVKNAGGRNGAIGPDYFQLDLRAGWHGRAMRDHGIELFVDIFNVTNRANFDNPSGDERVPSTFLVLTNLRGGGGFPRQAQMGLRYTF
jgi:outer membrane receptor protein involved in Fe transport